MKPYLELQIRSATDPSEWHLVKIFKNGNMICECFANMYDKDRDIKSKCVHVKQLKEMIKLLKDKT